LVATHGQRTTSDKLPEATANVIKTVAYLLEEATVALYINSIMERINLNARLNTNDHGKPWLQPHPYQLAASIYSFMRCRNQAQGVIFQ